MTRRYKLDQELKLMKPLIQSSRLVKLIDIPDHSVEAMLYDNIESIGLVKYEYMIVAFRYDDTDPFMYVTSELNSNYEPERCNSHLLCVFKDNQHYNFGSSDSYGEMYYFETNAIEIIKDCVTTQQ